MNDNVMKKLSGIILNGALVIAVLLLLSAAGLAVTGISAAVVTSGSMEPVIHTGSLVFIDTNERDIVKRDIIAFESGGATVVHRVVETGDQGFVTKGDANESPDPGVAGRDALKGKVVMWIPWIGYPVRGLSSPVGIILIVTICIVLLLISSAGKAEVGRNAGKKNTVAADDSSA